MAELILIINVFNIKIEKENEKFKNGEIL